MEETTFTPKNDINYFLDDNFNYFIYCSLNLDEKGVFYKFWDPLEFFNTIYTEFQFIKNNQSKPHDVIVRLNALNIDDKQRLCLYHYLSKFIERNFIMKLITYFKLLKIKL